MRGVVPLLALTVACSGCGGLQPLTTRVHGTKYTVTAPLLATPGSPVYACYLMLNSLPPAGCSGVEVRNLGPAGIAGVAGAYTYHNGIVVSPSVRLVGRWDGQALTLTDPPTPGHRQSTPRPVLGLPPAAQGAAPTQLSQRIADDIASLRRHGVQVLEVGVGQDGVDVVLAVADARAVQALRGKYGDVHISGWLQPL
jgi:hypothetical protein